jgi:DDE superfamily endonuclease
MPTLPSEFAPIILAFAPLFFNRVWRCAQVLLLGAILSPGKRTVTSALRVMGLSEEPHFQIYHRVLNRAVWSCRHASLILLRLLLAAFVPTGPLVLGIDDTIERRWGPKIVARGIYRDPVRSSDSHFVKTSGLRWISLMLLAPIPWAGHVWALPFLTALAPSERYWKDRKRSPKILTDWARQLVLQLQRWAPSRTLVLVADGGFAALRLLTSLVRRPQTIICVTRLRLDARLFGPAPLRKKGAKGRPRLVGTRLPSLQRVLTNPATVWQRLKFAHWYREGQRQVEIASGTAVWYHGGLPPLPIRWVLVRDPKGKFETRALLCTDVHQSPRQILEWFLLRWQVEVTFQEVRAHLGVETQRQWSNLAIARTTPVLLGLFSIVTLLAHRLARRGTLPIRRSAWYVKSHPTFSDAIALVRQRIWRSPSFFTSLADRYMMKIPKALFASLMQAACYAQ